MSIRYARAIAPATAAGVISAVQSIQTIDDNVDRRVTGVAWTNQTRLIGLVVLVNGVPIAAIDGGVSLENMGFYPFDETYGAGLLFQFQVNNNSAGALAANTDVVIFRYVPRGPALPLPAA